jgi:hypothetical protein
MSMAPSSSLDRCDTRFQHAVVAIDTLGGGSAAASYPLLEMRQQV